jgi:hypothetical protein
MTWLPDLKLAEQPIAFEETVATPSGPLLPTAISLLGSPIRMKRRGGRSQGLPGTGKREDPKR